MSICGSKLMVLWMSKFVPLSIVETKSEVATPQIAFRRWRWGTPYVQSWDHSRYAWSKWRPLRPAAHSQQWKIPSPVSRTTATRLLPSRSCGTKKKASQNHLCFGGASPRGKKSREGCRERLPHSRDDGWNTAPPNVDKFAPTIAFPPFPYDYRH